MDYPLSLAGTANDAYLHLGKFTDGTPDGVTPPSRDPAGTMNDVIDSIIAVQTAGGLVAEEGNVTQLRDAIQVLIDTALAGIDATEPLADASLRRIGAGLQINQVVVPVGAGGKAVAAADHMANLVAIAACTLTLGEASVVGMLAVRVLALGGAVTVTPDAGDSINGAAAGAPYVLPKGASAYLVTDGVSGWYLHYSAAAGGVTVLQHVRKQLQNYAANGISGNAQVTNWSLAITPKSATSLMIARVGAQVYSPSGGNLYRAVGVSLDGANFASAGTNYAPTSYGYIVSAESRMQLDASHAWAPGNTNPLTVYNLIYTNTASQSNVTVSWSSAWMEVIEIEGATLTNI